MTQIALIRAGSSDFDKQGRVQGSLSVPLSADGREEVRRMADELRGREIDAIYACESEPAWQTGQLLAQHLGLKVKRIDELRNVNHGLWEGCLVEELRRKHPKVFRQWEDGAENVCPPQGETLSEVRDRLLPVLQRMVRKHREGTIGIVVHRPLVELLLSELADPALGGLHQLATFEHWELLGAAASPSVVGSNAAPKA